MRQRITNRHEFANYFITKISVRMSYMALLIIGVFLFGMGCEKDITLDLPITENKVVVEGHIEPGVPPYVILTKNLPYFTKTDVNALENLFIHGAVITVNNGTEDFPLIEYCSDSVPDSLLALGALYLGVTVEDLTNYNFCIYAVPVDTVTPINILLGDIGKSYNLTIESEGKTYTATTTIPIPVLLDSTWYTEFTTVDSISELWARFKEPAGLGDYYRVFTQRLNKDDFFIPNLSSVFNDQYIDGTTYDIQIRRGEMPNQKEGDVGYYKKGDTVAIKWCTIDKAHYEFWNTALQEIDNVGNPLATSTLVATNIDGGGLGIWGGYGAVYDTVIFK